MLQIFSKKQLFVTSEILSRHDLLDTKRHIFKKLPFSGIEVLSACFDNYEGLALVFGSSMHS